ncbi:hypothetical protein BH09BAC2_BH09BAC2_15840 [soil metagenome]
MSFPKISIVTPSYNQGQYIEQTICSVLDQNYPNLEYIIIDGDSTDNTLDIIRKYEKHITYWISEKDKGQTDAINKGFAKCTGEIFNWLNSDDYYEPGTFQMLAQKFSSAEIYVVCGKERSFIDNEPTVTVHVQHTFIEKDIFETIRKGIMVQPATFFKKKCIDNFFPLDITLRYMMDRQLWWSYLLKYGQDKIITVNKIITNFRLHPHSKTISEQEYFEEDFNTLKRTLFAQLNAPVILNEQVGKSNMLVQAKWQINIKPKKFILAAFAAWYAQRNYVNDKLTAAKLLIKFVKQSKGLRMNKQEWRLWIICCLLPQNVLLKLKKIKNN